MKPPVAARRSDLKLSMTHGIGQLSLVEHALCPLDVRLGHFPAGFQHQSSYQYSDRDGRRRTARVRVACPNGLTAYDEFYLWGLLALTLDQDSPTAEFHATPHYCLRHLRIIDQHARRGGRQYQQFAESLQRLAAVNYQSDGFYDPIRREHRRVSFGFLSYSLPLSDDSSRAWRIAWDGVLFEFVSAVGGRLRFDLQRYRDLDPASRRLFLFLNKLFRRRTTMRFDLRHLGVQVLGYAPTLAERDLKIKVRRVLQRLTETRFLSEGVIHSTDRTRHGNMVRVIRGDVIETKAKPLSRPVESPLADLLRSIGLDDASVMRCLKRFPTTVLQQWADITLAARERHGESFFKRSAAAYFIDNVQQAAQGTRTPPDWWHDLQKAERRSRGNLDRQVTTTKSDTAHENPMASLTDAVFRHFHASGQSAELAQANAERFAATCTSDVNPVDAAVLLRLLN